MRSGLQKKRQWRLIALRGVLALLLLIVLVRFYNLQVRQHEYFTQKAEYQYQQRVRLTSPRGAILDRNRHELAISVDTDSIYGVPEDFKDAAKIKQLASVLEISSKNLRNKLTSSRSFVWIKRRITPKQTAAVKRLNLSGIGFIRESKRYYPQKQLVSNLIGFVGADNQGLEGVESYYEEWIKGGKRLVEVKSTEPESTITDIKPEPNIQGYDVILNLDKTIQHIVRQELIQACKEFDARQGVVVAMDPQSGEILAMVSEPSYNPNSFSKYSPKYWRNKAITDCYEPGSVIKVFVAAAALEERLFSPTDNLWCEQGGINVAGHIIHDTGNYGDLSFSRVLELSSNVGAVKIGLALGQDRLYDYLHGFGFGAPTKVDLPGEAAGILRPPSKWSRLSIGTISIGQEISVTPLQLVNAISVIANGGWLLQPRAVNRLWDDQAQRSIKEYGNLVKRRVVSEKTCKALTSILTRVVEQGTGKLAGLTNYKVAGKTGSAQKFDSETGTYAKDKWVAWFLGFVPADRPRLAMVVMLDEPQRGEWASDVAAPVFSRIAQSVLNYMEVLPDLKQQTPKLKLAAKGFNTAKRTDNNISPKKQQPDNDNIQKTGKLIVLPDLKGKSMRRVVDELSTRGLLVELEGSGRAVKQEPLPGTKLPAGSICKVSFIPLYEREMNERGK